MMFSRTLVGDRPSFWSTINATRAKNQLSRLLNAWKVTKGWTHEKTEHNLLVFWDKSNLLYSALVLSDCSLK